jgi:WD40 repeat protein
VSRRVKIFDFGACLEGGDAVMHYPALQITTRSKLSSVAWSAYVKSQLISSDYGGLIQLWDASTAGEAAQYDEHARRVWSVDFSQTDPMRFLRWAPRAESGQGRWAGPRGVAAAIPSRSQLLPCWHHPGRPLARLSLALPSPPPSLPPSPACSGSDDGSVRLWSVHEASSVQRIAAPANVCSVQFSPTDSHTIAYGCANYRVYLHDLRMPGGWGGARTVVGVQQRQAVGASAGQVAACPGPPTTVARVRQPTAAHPPPPCPLQPSRWR